MGSSQSTPSSASATVATQAQLQSFQYVAQYAAAAYCNSADSMTGGTLVACSNDACPDLQTNRVFLEGILDANDGTGTAGYVGVDPARKVIVVAFKGTDNAATFAYDLEAITTDTHLCDGCMIHGGFATSFDNIHPAMTNLVKSARESHPDFSIITTGHSLGAAMATMAGAWLRHDGYPCDIFTYGSPRIGNEKLASYISQQAGNEYRITHLNDPVPRLPGHWLGYRHTDMEYWLSTGEATTIDYGVSDIKICEGTYNTNCNGAGSMGTSYTPHGYYFRKIGACKNT